MSTKATSASALPPLDPANGVELSGIGKHFRILTGSGGRIADFLAHRLATRRFRRELRALDGVTCEVRRGEVLGIVGTNGAGKSTLLRIIAGISLPTVGEVRRAPKVAALLDLTAGFHPSLTGYENLYLAASLQGLPRAEMRRIMPDVVAFSGLSHAYLDQPVRTYSSGMITRLAFSLAVMTDPDVVLIDEVLAVGDAEFQARSAHRLLQFRTQGKAMVFVSHMSNAVAEMSDRVLWLDAGKVRAIGPSNEVIGMYDSYLNRRIARRARHDAARAADLLTFPDAAHDTEAVTSPPDDVEIASLTVDDGDGNPRTEFETGAVMRLSATIRPRVPLRDADLLFQLMQDNRAVVEEFTANERGITVPDGDVPFRVTMRFDPLLLLRGRYWLVLHVVDRNDTARVHGSSPETPVDVRMEYTAKAVMPGFLPTEYRMD